MQSNVIFLFRLILTIQFVFIDVQIFQIYHTLLNRKPRENWNRNKNDHLKYFKNHKNTLLAQSTYQCGDIHICSSTSDGCCPKNNGECDPCCGDLCIPNYLQICESTCFESYGNTSEYNTCTGTNSILSTIQSTNISCMNNEDCITKKCGTIDSCAQNKVCCSNDIDIFNRCISQTEYSMCDSMSYCDDNLDCITESNVCGQCRSRTGCNFLHNEFTSTYFMSATSSFLPYSSIMTLYNTCLERSEDEESKKGCNAYLNSYMNNNICARFEVKANSMITTSTLITVTTTTSIKECCDICTTNDVCMAFSYINGACRFYSELMLINSDQATETYFVKEFENQPPSPPSPPNPPPPPVCAQFIELQNFRLICSQESNTVTSVNASICCESCSNLNNCNSFTYSPQISTCHLYICTYPIGVTDLQSDTASISYIMRDFKAQMPPSSSSNTSSTESLSSQFLQTEVLIPIIVGSISLLALVVLIFYFCNSERSKAASSFFETLGNIVQKIRGKKENKTIIIPQIPKQSLKTIQQSDITQELSEENNINLTEKNIVSENIL